MRETFVRIIFTCRLPVTHCQWSPFTPCRPCVPLVDLVGLVYRGAYFLNYKPTIKVHRRVEMKRGSLQSLHPRPARFAATPSQPNWYWITGYTSKRTLVPSCIYFSVRLKYTSVCIISLIVLHVPSERVVFVWLLTLIQYIKYIISILLHYCWTRCYIGLR